MSDSILDSVKKSLEIDEKCDSFDKEIIMHINSTFFVLYQIGVVSSSDYTITGFEEEWNSKFDSNDILLNAIKEYTFSKVRMLFDPPSNSSVTESLKSYISELEWRINIQAEGGFDGNNDDSRRLYNSLRCKRHEVGEEES